MVKTKVCCHCKKRKELKHLKRDIRKPGGHSTECKKCVAKLASIWRKQHKPQRRIYGRLYFHRIRMGALGVVGRGKLYCRNCKCSSVKLLEINHINGGGRKEFLKRNYRFYLDIVKKRRKITDLNVLCRICNVLHYLKRKHGKLPYKILYNVL